VKFIRLLLLIALFAAPLSLIAQEEPPAPEAQPQRGQQGQRGPQGQEGEGQPRDRMASPTFNGLRLRSIGPALTSGRIAALAVDEKDKRVWWVAVASGNVWKTTNAGTSFAPVFDTQGSYSIGAVTIDPNNSDVVWVGTGENNSQRSVGYGDGLYKTEDGGRSWRNVGLKNSEHIGKILVDPRNSDVVYVAAQGPLWGPGGDRGLYKTTDGGKTWEKVLEIGENKGENTGVSDIAMDPRNPDVIYASAYQRRRHVWTLINGGPEGGIHKTTDGGKTWTRLRSGLPAGNLGRIGLAIAPSNPDIVYATVEAAENRGGIFRTTNRGATWQRRNPYDTTAMYYGKIFVDPKNSERIFVMNVRIMYSEDGGTTLTAFPSRWKHVDNHAHWVDPDNGDHMLSGNDGGLYETWDNGANWRFMPNLPITQFYTVAVDNSEPFYYVCGGTQDNNTQCGPSRTRNASGITNQDWFITVGGDGFRVAIDPKDPNIIYSESQHGNLVRYDRRTGERVGIKPKEGKGDPALRWNWDSPLLISPHSNSRIYFAANVLFRSDDRGDSWRPISGDLTRQIDRNKLPVMGKVWGVDAVAKSASTSFYGNLTSLDESPRKEGLIYVGADDGLIQVTEDGGKNWRKVEKVGDVPDMSYVSRLMASQHDANTIYAAFHNFKNADFKPYVFKSTDAGRTWKSVAGDLPENGPVWALAEDHVNPNLLFLGTEFGLFFTTDGGTKWIRLRGSFPTISVRELAIQRRENDLAVGTFGRSFYILDDYTPLRALKPETLNQEAVIFPIKEAKMFIQASPIGGGKGSQGETFFNVPNPPIGATFTYYLRDPLRTKRQQRQAAERAAERRGQAPPYPTADQLRAEDTEEPPVLLFTITDTTGNIIRRIQAPAAPGFNRITWNMRYPSPTIPTGGGGFGGGGGGFGGGGGMMVVPGNYRVSLSKRVDGKTTQIVAPVPFTVSLLDARPLSASDLADMDKFQKEVMKLQRALAGTLEVANSARTRVTALKRALQETPGDTDKLRETANSIEARLNELAIALTGDRSVARRNEPTPMSISQRIGGIVGDGRLSIYKPTGTQREQYAIASELLSAEMSKLRTLVDRDLAALEKAAEAAGAPHTPGRFPEWRPGN